MESTFSSPAEAALQREAGVPGQFTSPEDLDRVYELERVTKFVCDLECQRVRADSENGTRKGGAGSPLGMGCGDWDFGCYVTSGLRKSRSASIARITHNSVGLAVPLEVGAWKV